MPAPPSFTARRPRPEQAVLYTAGAALLASGVFHVLVWLVDGGSLGGPVSWRKPILFGISAGATVLSIGWLAGKLERRRGDLVLLASFAVAMLVEVGLITLQQWRGVPSHFYRATPLDAAILAGIEWLVVFATIVIAELTRRSFQRLPTSSEMSLAIRGGMSLLLFSCLLGFVLVSYGNDRQAQGLAPEVFGAAGVMKFPHGVPMHAIQFLPILAWVLRRLHVAERTRYLAVASALGSVLAFTVYSLLQTFTGRARFEFWWLSSIVLLVSVVLMAVPAWIGLVQAVRRWLAGSAAGGSTLMGG